MEDVNDIQYFSLKKVKKFLKENDNNPFLAKELTQLVLDKDPLISMRASWTLQHLCFAKPKLIYPQIPKLIKFLHRNNNHTGAMRNVIRIFQEIDIPGKYCSEVFDLCLRFIKNVALPHAVRVFSVYVLVNICKKYPELKHEVELIIYELKNYPQPPSMEACIRNTTKQLNKIPG